MSYIRERLHTSRKFRPCRCNANERAPPFADGRVLNRRSQVLLLGSTRMRRKYQGAMQATNQVYHRSKIVQRSFDFMLMEMRVWIVFARCMCGDFFITLRGCYAKLRAAIRSGVIRWWKQRDKPRIVRFIWMSKDFELFAQLFAVENVRNHLKSGG